MKKDSKETAEIKIGDKVSVPFGKDYLQGEVQSVEKDRLTINNFENGLITVPNNDSIYKFRPGQKFDLRQFNVVDPTSGKSLKDRLDDLLKQTDAISFNNLFKTKPKQVSQLLFGKITSEVIQGSSLLEDKETGKKFIKNWKAKLMIYKGKDGHLKLNLKLHKNELSLNVYGKDITAAEKSQMIDKGQSVALTRETKGGKQFKVFAKYDKDLNSIVTTPYSKAIEERMKVAYAKKETEGQAKKVDVKPTAETKVKTTQETAKAKKETVKTTKPKSKKI